MMLRAGAQFHSKCSGCSAHERHFFPNFAPHGSAIFFEISGCSARERNFLQNVQDAPHGSAILMNKRRNFEGAPHAALSSPKFTQDAPHGLPNVHMLRTGARFSQKFQDALQGSAISDEETTKF